MIRNIYLPLLLFCLIGCTSQVATPITPDRPTVMATAVSISTATVTPIPTLVVSSTPVPTPTFKPTLTATPTEEPTIEFTLVKQWGRGMIEDMALSGDGRWLAVGTATGVYIHPTESLSEIAYHLPTVTGVATVALSPDGQQLIASLWNGWWQAWDVPTQTLLHKEEREIYSAIEFSPDGRWFAANDGEQVLIHQTSDYTVAHQFFGKFGIRFAPDSKQVAVWNYGGFELYTWPTPELMYEVEPYSDEQMTPSVGANAQFLADGSPIFSSLATIPNGLTGEMLVQEGADGRLAFMTDAVPSFVSPPFHSCETPTFLADPPSAPVSWQMELSSDEQIVGFLMQDVGYGNMTEQARVRFYERHTGQFRYELPKDVVDFAVSPNSDTWFAGGKDGSLQRLSLQDGTVLEQVTLYTPPAFNLAVSPDSQLVAVTYLDEVQIWRVADATIQARYPTAQQIAFAPDGETVALGYADGRLEIRTVADNQLITNIAAHEEVVTALTYLSDEQLVSASQDCTVAIWHPITGVLQANLPAPELDTTSYLSSLATRLNGEQLLGLASNQIYVWDITNSQLLSTLDTPNNPDMLLTTANDRVVLPSLSSFSARLDENGELLSSWRVTRGGIRMAFSPDERFLVTGSGDSFVETIYNGQIRLFQGTDDTPLHVATPTTKRVTGLIFAPDGSYFVSLSLDGVVRVWFIDG